MDSDGNNLKHHKPSLLGVDLMVGTNRRSFRIAEINAFGDLLPGVLDQGMDTYEAQLHAWRPDQYCPHRSEEN